MANIKSQKKRIRTNEAARLRNQAVKSEVRTEIRKLREIVAEGNKEAAEAQLRHASRKLDKAVSKGVLHRNNAANKKSAMALLVNKMA
ncbi:MAG: 30S ribosomal protein S20 [Corynebacterium sp.]|nr:30S ribosomal protein S20 [Corynebacterium sp.]